MVRVSTANLPPLSLVAQFKRDLPSSCSYIQHVTQSPTAVSNSAQRLKQPGPKQKNRPREEISGFAADTEAADAVQ